MVNIIDKIHHSVNLQHFRKRLDILKRGNKWGIIDPLVIVIEEAIKEIEMHRGFNKCTTEYLSFVDSCNTVERKREEVKERESNEKEGFRLKVNEQIELFKEKIEKVKSN